MRRDYRIIIFLSLLFFVPFLGAVHLFDWDEINFAECAREMLLTGDWFRPQIDFEPFWEKPPMFLWMQALSMHVFGVGEFAARLPNALCGLATLLLVYHLGKRIHDRVFGWLWVLGWLGSLLPHLYFKSGIIDPWFNFFIFLGLYGFIEFRWQFFTNKNKSSWWVQYRHLLMGGLSVGFAILTKGPTAYLIVMLVLGLYWAKYRFKGRGYFSHLVWFSLAACIAPAIWFGLEVLQHGPWFVQEFIAYQIRLFATPDSGHGGFFGYHVVALLLGCFPIAVFAIPNLWGDRQAEAEIMESDTLLACKRSDFGTWMQLLFWVVLILFSIVQTKILHYSSLCYFPLTYLGALTLWRGVHWNRRPVISPILLLLIGPVLGFAVAALPWLGLHIDQIKPLFSKDAFALANLDAHVHWHEWEGFPGILLIIGCLLGAYFWFRKKVWTSVTILFGSSALFTAFTMLLIVPNIEGYSQLAAIEFYESKCGQDCYIRTVGFKSYAHLYYACKKPLQGDKTVDDYAQLAFGKLEKPAYFVAKVTNLGDLPNLPGCHELYRKNGFVFYERK